MVAGRRDERRLEALEEEQIRKEADQLQQPGRDERGDDTDEKGERGDRQDSCGRREVAQILRGGRGCSRALTHARAA